jgi:hypothetical protein
MSTTKFENVDYIKLSKQPFSIPQLIITLLFSTYFLTIQTIELNLSIYVLQKNKIEIYREYLLFKRQAPIWKWWQSFSTIILLLSLITTVRDLIQTLTRKATFKRNLLDILKALQLFIVLYISFTHILPLHNKLIESISMDNIRQLNSFQWIVFLLNILGWFIPIFRHQEWKNDEHMHPKKKTQ